MKRRAALGILSAAALAISGCATSTRPLATDRTDASWTGRLALRIDSEPVQTFAALFDLRGTPERGELTLTSPIGSTLARLEWSPGSALLKNGNQTRRFDSVDALIVAATGAPVPVVALFDWLGGREAAAPGWRPDLSQVGAGRLQATRESPSPRADLRIVFERA